MMGDNVSIGVPASGKTTSLETKLRLIKTFLVVPITYNDEMVKTRKT